MSRQLSDYAPMPTPAVDQLETDRLKLGGGLLLGGFLLNAVVTVGFHPGGHEDDHREIFTDYADSGGWVATHFGQFAGVMIALAGLLVLYRAFAAGGRPDLLAGLGAAAAIAAAAGFAVLQGLDGIALKKAVDTWVDSSGTQEATAFANAETIRWLEEGFQSYFRLLLGLSFALFGAAIIVRQLVPAWLGWVAALAGVLSIAVGIDVGYSGLESGFQDVVLPLSQLAILVFAIAVLVTGVRGRDQRASVP
jgi:hypothetical protein